MKSLCRLSYISLARDMGFYGRENRAGRSIHVAVVVYAEARCGVQFLTSFKNVLTI